MKSRGIAVAALVGGGLLALVLLSSTTAQAAERVNVNRRRYKVDAASLLRLANSKRGQAYVLGAVVPKDEPGYSGPWDCAEFVTWAVFQSTGRLVGVQKPNGSPKQGSWTGFWTDDARAERGVRRISVEEAIRTPGAILLRYPQSGAYGHIAISDGRGGTVEAMGSKYGVTAGRAVGRRWDTGLLVDDIEPGVASQVSVTPATQILRIGSKGADVVAVQKAVGAVPDGDFGTETSKAVVAYQLAHGLVPDGEVGPLTLAAMKLSGA